MTLIDTAILLTFTVIVLLQQQYCDATAVEYETCKDRKQTDYCKLIFEKTQEDCQKPEYWGVAQHCRVTCKNCSAYMCPNPLPDAVVNCTALESFCHDKQFGHIIQARCPATCGSCKKATFHVCDDKAPAAICKSLKIFCDLKDGYDTMTANCPSTCERCPAKEKCEDTITDCSKYLAYCDNPLYVPLMLEKCKKSCNKCPTPPVVTTTASPKPKPAKCVDKAGCPVWVKKGFCTSTTYTQQRKREICPKSCGLCP